MKLRFKKHGYYIFIKGSLFIYIDFDSTKLTFQIFNLLLKSRDSHNSQVKMATLTALESELVFLRGLEVQLKRALRSTVAKRAQWLCNFILNHITYKVCVLL